ncbi:hypothetical protein CDAR_496101 [Caerostris darwini]|uniref:Uncharacterized protein n=1 Tax=Caerostris darwini TaxID=1538125 RepID=A0AAV4U1X0_9ARAC|nr:hypothetical protein CDAR_496101 [Caerostris darwini]
MESFSIRVLRERTPLECPFDLRRAWLSPGRRRCVTSPKEDAGRPSFFSPPHYSEVRYNSVTFTFSKAGRLSMLDTPTLQVKETKFAFAHKNEFAVNQSTNPSE